MAELRGAGHAARVRALFDHKASGWPAKYAPDGPLTGRLAQLAAVLSYHLPANGRVLHLGCGTGELARYIAAAGLLVVGCDIAPKMLHQAAAAGLCTVEQPAAGAGRAPMRLLTFQRPGPVSQAPVQPQEVE